MITASCVLPFHRVGAMAQLALDVTSHYIRFQCLTIITSLTSLPAWCFVPAQQGLQPRPYDLSY